MTHYRFEIYAWTSVGRGPSKVAVIQSGVEPVLPDPPTKLAVSNIEAFSVVLQFTPGFDGNSSIIKWVMQVCLTEYYNACIDFKLIYATEAVTLHIDALTMPIKHM